MYTVYCYAYYFTIKGTNVGNSGLCYYQGWNFKNHCGQRCFLAFFSFFLTYGNNQFLKKKDRGILDKTSFYKKKKKVRKSFRITSESPFSTFHVRSDISDDENKMVSHHFLVHENTELDYVLKYLSAFVNSIPDCYFYYLTIKKTR